MPLSPSQMNDLLTAALKNLGEGKWTDLSTNIQEFYGMPQLMKKEKVTFDGGTSIQRNIMVDHQDSARATELFEVDDVNIREQFKTIDVPWRHGTASYAFERREVAMARGPRQLLDLVKARRAGAMTALAIKIEEWLFGSPGSDDGKTPYGIPYWVCKHPSGGGATPGFIGTAPFGAGTYQGNLNHARWKNWAGKYTNVTKADLVAKMRRAARMIQFKSPVSMPQYSGPPRRQIYLPITVLEALESLAESQNTELGRDIASMDGNTVFRRIPMNWVPYLDSDPDEPVYMIDWEPMKICFLSGEYMNEQGPVTAPNQHTVSRVFIDLTYNVVCDDIRRQAVLSKKA